jgi:3'(2'), 5'-bisphosphate nucleotidase
MALPLPASELLTAVTDIAQRAGREILEIYGTDFQFRTKADESPLTEADLRSHRLIVDALRKLSPSLPVLSEESAAIPLRSAARARYWLGTSRRHGKELSRNGEFTVNIALIAGTGPNSASCAPVSDTTYSAFRRRRLARDRRARAPAHFGSHWPQPLRVGAASHGNLPSEGASALGRMC